MTDNLRLENGRERKEGYFLIEISEQVAAAVDPTNVLTLSLGDIPNPIRKLVLTTFGSAHIYCITFCIHILTHFAKHVPASIVFLASDRWTESRCITERKQRICQILIRGKLSLPFLHQPATPPTYCSL